MKKIIIFIMTIALLLTIGCSNTINEPSEPNINGNNETPSDNNSNQDDDPENIEDSHDSDKINTGLFDKYGKEASVRLESLSLEEKIGQMFLVRSPLEEDLDKFLSFNPGGFILFARDFTDKTKNEVINNIDNFQAKSKLPLIIGVDEEGGTVVRVSLNSLLSKERFKSPQELYEIGGFEEIERDAKYKSQLLLDLGINLNLSPVADVSENKEDFIYQRAFGKSALETSQYVSVVVNAMKESGISSTLKHFPGYGSNVDTHEGLAYDNRTYESFVKNDFLPFIAGIKAGTDSILVSHNIIESIDPNSPASLSKNVIDILRNDLEFTGIIFTDDLSMGAIQEFEIQSPAVSAVKAGNDMLIVTDFEKNYTELLNAVKAGDIPIDRINESVLRILKWKYYKGLIKK